jgi:hypothetical protein
LPLKAYQDPALASDETAARWREYRREATRRLAVKVRGLARAQGVPGGGWVGMEMSAAHLAGAFDFLGGRIGSQELLLRVKNTGGWTSPRIQGPIDLRALEMK